MKSLFLVTLFALSCFLILGTAFGESEPFHVGDGNDHAVQINQEKNSEHDAEVIILDDSMSIARKRSQFGRKSDFPEEEKPILVDAQHPQPRSERLASTDIKTNPTEVTTNDPKPAKQTVQAKVKNSQKTKKVSQKPTTTGTTPTTTKQNLVTTSTPPSTKQVPTTTTLPPGTSETPEITSQTGGATSPTTTAKTTPTPTPASTSKPIPEDMYCLCDIHSNACDMNCCCDTDCSDEDRAFFSHCSDQVGIHDERSAPRRQRSCFKSFVTFKHYTAESGVLNDNGMLCILRDNSKVDNVLPSSKLDEIHKRITAGEIDIQPKYSMDSNRKVAYKQEAYKYGSPIVGVKVMELLNEKVDLVPYGFPSTYHSIPCNEIKEPVKFLENSYSRCQLSITNLTKDCSTVGNLDANSFINHMQILTNPGKSGAEENSDREFVSITAGKMCNAELCSTDWDVENDNNEFPRPIYNRGKQLCQNILTGLNVTFYYGLEGITEVVASAQLQDLPIISTTQLTQEFHSNFVWNTEINSTDEVDEESSWPRSGNPGYIVGKPVIMGEKVTVLKETLKANGKQTSTTPNPEDEEEEEKESKEIEMVKVSKDPSGWLTIHGPGKCPENPHLSPRKFVLFDYSHMTLCSLNLTEFKYCEDLQLQVAKVLVGVSDPLNFEKRLLQVAAFGNSNPKEPSGWVPITTKNFPLGIISTAGNSKGLISKGCDSILSSLHITITYAFVGSTDFPQAKITGVLYEPGDSVSFLPRDVSKSFSVSTTVSFKDVTGPAIMRIARWPVLSITLPKDFFYPFSR